MELSINGQNLLKKLHFCLIDCKKQNSWPGTQTEGDSFVYYYKLNNDSAEIIKKHSEGLYSWIQPNLPEDLCFFKHGRQEWIINVAHESFGGIKSNDIEEIKRVTNTTGII